MPVLATGRLTCRLALCLLPLIPVQAGAESAKVMDFSRASIAMNAAMDAARASLPEFLDKAAKADLTQGDYRVKWAHATETGEAGLEHIWVTLSAVGPDSVKGQLANQPQEFRGAIGDVVEVPLDGISDWMRFRADGLIEGCYTTRVMLSQMSEAEREGYEAQLAPLPEPPRDVKISAAP